MTMTRIYRLTAAEGRQQALFEALGQLTGVVRPLPGCRGIELMMDLQRPGAYTFIERWASPEAHKATSPGIPKDAFAPIMAALAGPPDVVSLDTLLTA